MIQTFNDTVGVDARRLVKIALATALCRTRAQVMLGSLLRRATPLVVGYHRVVRRFYQEHRGTMPGMLVSRAMLERHLDAIGRRHRFVTLHELGQTLERGDRPPRPLAAVTFDDGYRDVYENAFPLLVKKGIPAAVFVVSDLVGTSDLQVHDKLFLLISRGLSRNSALLAALPPRLTAAGVNRRRREHVHRTASSPAGLTLALMRSLSRAHVHQLMVDLEAEVGLGDAVDEGLLPVTWEMLSEMHAKDVTIGSHTRSHVWLANEPADVVARETEGSRRSLERRLGASVRHFAYPDGCFNRTAVRAVAESGYQFGYTTCPHRDPRYPFLTIPRRVLWEHSSVDAAGQFVPEILDCQTQGFFVGPRACTPRSHG